MTRFPVTERSRIRRMPARGHYEREQVYAVLDAALICHLGYVIDGQPYVTPTAYWRHEDRLYWHGSAESRMLTRQSAGLPVCLAVTHLDGLVLARSGLHHSINYRSVMAFGRAQKVDDPAEKALALDAYMERFLPGRAREVRPVRPDELKATAVLRMAIEEASAKVRSGPPFDDEADYALPVWAGVLPVRQVMGEAEPDPRLAPGTPLPSYVAAFAPGVRFDDILARLAKGASAPPARDR